MKGEIENKNQFSKREKIKRMRTKLVKIIYHQFRFKDEIKKKKKTFIEEPRKTKLEMKIMRIKLKKKYHKLRLKDEIETNKTFLKGSRKKN